MKKTMLRLTALLLIWVLLTGCSGSDTKEYTCQELTMEVPFYMSDESDDEAFAAMTFALDSFRIAIFGLREELSLFEDTIVESIEDYAEGTVELNELDCEIHAREGKDYRYFVYESTADGESYTYLAGVFKSSEAYWLIQIAVTTDNYNEADFLTILDSVTFG